MLVLRGVLILGLFVVFAFTGGRLASADGLTSVVRQASGALPGNEIGGLSLSIGVDERARPIGPSETFAPDTLRLWVSFNYYDFKAGSKVRYVIKANGDLFQEGDLGCCEGANGRYAFPIEYERDRPFGGAGYEVIIVVGKVEASRGSFVVTGTGGFDNDNCDDDSLTQRGNLRSSTQGKC